MSTPGLEWRTCAFDELGAVQLYAILKLRQAVFIVEQDCIYQDLDDLDQQSIHICCSRDGDLLAYLRCLPPGLDYTESALGRIVVSPSARGLQLGRELVQRGIDCNQSRWPGSGIRIGAQAHLEGFYHSLGFTTASDVYDEDGIPHIKMTL
ncbi:MAG: GNAT family N-acetyltransferase [Halieaceae bacterium]